MDSTERTRLHWDQAFSAGTLNELGFVISQVKLSSLAGLSISPELLKAKQKTPSTAPLNEQCEYDEGLHFFSSFLRVSTPAPESAESQSETAACLLYNAGQVELLEMQYESAQAFFVDALVMTKFMRKEQSDKLTIPILHSLGYAQYRNEEIEASIETFKKAMVVCRSEANATHIAATLNCLGVVYFHLTRAQTAEAKECLTSALSLQRTLFGKHRIVATTLNNIGRVYFMEARFEEAMAVYSEALEIRRSILGTNHADVAATVYNIGQTYHQMDKLDEALEFYEEFLRISAPTRGCSHQRHVCNILKCEAQVFYRRQDYDRALSLYQDALVLGQATLGAHAEVASIMNKIGNLQYEMRNFEEAIKVYYRGLDMERIVLDENHPNIAVTLSNIAQVHKQLGDYDSALALYREALALQMKAVGASDPCVALTLSNLGLILYQSRQYSVALDMYEEALRIRLDAFGESNLDVASSLNSIGLVLFKLGLNEMALKSFSQSLTIRRDILGETHRDVAVILYNIATLFNELGDEEKAISFYRETLRVEKSALGPHHPDVIITLQFIAQTCQQCGDLRDALKCFWDILQIQRLNFPENDLRIVQTLIIIANLELQRGNVDSVVDVMSDAARIAKRAGGSEIDARLSGFYLYSFAKLHPESAAAA
jgi:tetratricopeptide (TPR) repeat protein